MDMTWTLSLKEEKMKGLYNKDINSSYFLGRKLALPTR